MVVRTEKCLMNGKKIKRNSYTDKVKVDRIVEYAGLYSLDYFGSIVFDRITVQDFH